jgi:lycopene cyclase domain-containing protein
MSEYSWEVVGVLLLLGILDRVLGLGLLRRGRFLALLGLICAGTLLFDGYLDSRPVVLYGWRYLSGLQLWKVPLEDFGYGISMATIAVGGWELVERRQRDERDAA